jgi:hypothetical protein
MATALANYAQTIPTAIVCATRLVAQLTNPALGTSTFSRRSVTCAMATASECAAQPHLRSTSSFQGFLASLETQGCDSLLHAINHLCLLCLLSLRCLLRQLQVFFLVHLLSFSLYFLPLHQRSQIGNPSFSFSNLFHSIVHDLL